MCTTCFSSASEAVSWGTPALAAGAAAVMTGVRLRFPARRSTTAAPTEPQPTHASLELGTQRAEDEAAAP